MFVGPSGKPLSNTNYLRLTPTPNRSPVNALVPLCLVPPSTQTFYFSLFSMLEGKRVMKRYQEVSTNCKIVIRNLSILTSAKNSEEDNNNIIYLNC